jgi:hypothetical protein
MTTCPFLLLLGYIISSMNSHLDPSARARSRPTDPTIVKMTNSSILSVTLTLNMLNIFIKYVNNTFFFLNDLTLHT